MYAPIYPIRIYDLGYADIKDRLDLLAGFLEKQDALLVDVRFKPWSKSPIWRAENLRKVLGDRYVHIPALGNINYSEHGENIQYANLDRGIQEATRIMWLQSKSLVIMCQCWDRDHCHRMGILKRLEETACSIPSQPLVLADLRHINGKDIHIQKGLFDD